MAALSTHQWITIAACAAQLALATIALLRISKSPLAWPLALLNLALFAANAGDVASGVTGAEEWIWLDASATSLWLPLTLHFALVFVGRRGFLRWLQRALYFYFGAIAVACLSAFVGVGWARSFAGAPQWAWAIGLGAAISLPMITYLFISHLGASHSGLERARTWLVIGGYALAAGGNVCDLLADLRLDVPRLGPLSTLLATLALTMVALRFGLFDRKISWLIAANALVVGVVQICAYLVLFRLFGGNRTLLTVATVTLTLALVPALVAMARTAATHRQRLEYHATLGRFSAQMAHDIRNPLAAIKGAAQFLKGELASGRPLIGERDYLQVILDQTNRVNRVLENYQRIGRIEPALATVSLNALVEGVLKGQALAAPPGVTVEHRPGAKLPDCQADADLVANALMNLVRNAYEAMPHGGVVTVQTEQPNADPRFIQLSVSDTGPGMDARVAEQAFSDFFTTKTTGSGLGLAFVRRVAEAHGGNATLKSDEGKGTTVRIQLPVS